MQGRNLYTLKLVGRLSCRQRYRKLTLFHKIHNNIAPEYLQDCLNEYLVVNNYNLRNSLQYRVPRCHLETFSKSFFLSTIRSWNSLDPNFKSIQTTSKFKHTLRANLFKVSNHYLLGSRKCNIIHTRLRHQCSSLGADLFRANIINDPSCACGCPLEVAIHYLLECPLYTNARMQLFMSITPYTVISIENLLFGSDNLTDENNLIVFRNVQKYIHHSNRFEWYEIIPCIQDVIIYLHSIPLSPHYFCLSNIFMYTFIILCNLLSFSYLCI